MNELVELNEKYKALMNALHRVGIGIDIVDRNYEILFQNKTLKERFGNIIGNTCYEKYMDLNEPCESCPMIKAINDNIVVSKELKGTDGRNYEIISAPLMDKHGLINSAAEIIIDITQHKLAEKEIKESEEKYKSLYENLPLSVILINQEGKIIDGNFKFGTPV